MSKWSLEDIGLTLGTGGGYGLYKIGRDYQTEQENATNDRNRSIASYNQKIMDDSNLATEKKLNDMYGNTYKNLGKTTDFIAGKLAENVDKNVAKADIYNQQQGRQRAIQAAKSNIQGVNQSADLEQKRRDAMYGAAGVNEVAKREGLGDYSSYMSGVKTSVNSLINQDKALAIAQLQSPEANYNAGLIANIFGGLGL